MWCRRTYEEDAENEEGGELGPLGRLKMQSFLDASLGRSGHVPPVGSPEEDPGHAGATQSLWEHLMTSLSRTGGSFCWKGGLVWTASSGTR